MKRSVRRLCSALLTLVMLASLFGGTMLPAQAQGGTITVYLNVASSGWKQGMVYWWGSAESVEWPGIPMHHEGDTLYSVQIPADATGVVFNDGNGQQGPDLSDPRDGLIFYVGESDWKSEICDHEYVDGICIHCGEEEPASVEDYTVYFDLDLSTWEQVYIYWWRDHDTIGDWPGERMTNVGGRVYSAPIPENVNGLLFTNGEGEQTADLELPGDGYLYDMESDVWVIYDACTHEWDEGRVETDATCTQSGWKYHACLLCGETLGVEILPYGHDWVDGICSRCGEEEPVPVEECTVYFDLGITPWEQVYFYWWRDNDTIGDWPGELMTHEGGSVYSAQVPEDVNGLLFTNGNGEQTQNLELPGDGFIYSKAEDNWDVHNGCCHEWDNGTVEKEPTCVERGRVIYTCELCDVTMTIEVYPYGHDWVDDICSRCGWDQNELCTIYFDMAFSERLYVNIYWWADGEDAPAWPGVPMTYEGGSIYSTRIPSYATGLVFNDEGFKDAVGNSPDLELPGDGYVYREKFGQWVLHNGCGHQWDGGEVVERADCLTDGLYVYTCGNCSDTIEVKIPAYGHSFADGFCQSCGEPDPTQMYTVYYDLFFSDRENVNIYWWTEDDNIGPWPGKSMTYEGGSIYSARVPADVVGIIFNDGNTQTGDLTLPGDGYVYREKLDEWVLHNGCCHEWEYQTVLEPTCTVEGEGAYVCQRCAEEYTFVLEPLGHEFENGFCTCCGEAELVTPEGMCTIYIDNTTLQYETLYLQWYVHGDGELYSVEMEHVRGSVYVAQVPQYAQVFVSSENHSTWLTDSLDPELDYHLYVKNSVWLPYYGCTHQWDDGVLAGPWDCQVGGSYRYTCQICDQFYGSWRVSTNHKFEDGICTVCGEKENSVPADFTGFVEEKDLWNEGWYYYHNGVKSQDTGLVKVDGDWWYIIQGKRSKTTSLVKYNNEWWYVVNGKVAFDETALVNFNAQWFYVVNGKVASKTTGLVKENNQWRYVVNGRLSAYTGLVKHNNEWWYVVRGTVDVNTNLLVKYNGEWFYVVGGKIASKTTTLVKYNNEWWYVVNGKIASKTTTLVKYNNEWWYVVNGKIASKTTTLVKYNNEWWYVVNGKIASKTTTLVKYNNEWWYVVNGKIASKTTTLVQYNGGWYYLVKGKLAAQTTTLVKYNGTWYYVNKGSVDWGYTGNFTFNGGTYRIVKGRVA